MQKQFLRRCDGNFERVGAQCLGKFIMSKHRGKETYLGYLKFNCNGVKGTVGHPLDG